MRTRCSIVLIVALLVSATAPLLAQGGNWFELKVDDVKGGKTYQNSQVDTTSWIIFNGVDWSIDSVQWAVKTTDTTRYRTALLYRCGNSAPYASYAYTAGAGVVPVDTLSSNAAALNGAFTPYYEPGAEGIALVIQFQAAGNHVTAPQIAAQKYQVFARVFYRPRR